MWEERWWVIQDVAVTPCEGRVSRNPELLEARRTTLVTPCEGRVSRNALTDEGYNVGLRHALRGACE